jgi:hypothetical protein
MDTLHAQSHSLATPQSAAAPAWFAAKSQAARRFIINLAPMRYATIAEGDGPIGQIDYGDAVYLGRPWHLSRALLKPGLGHPLGQELCLFHPADGSGVGATRLEARAKAVSEALERWAFFATQSGPDYARYGYAYANNSKGMAAFPAIFSHHARRLAVAEAYEHFAIDAWWQGALAHWSVQRDGATIVFIHVPEFQGFTALAIRHLALHDYVAAYGFGSGATPAQAEQKAQLEACRLETLLADRDQNFNRRPPVLAAEQRMLQLASPAGYSLVRDRLRAKPWRGTIAPKVIFDGPVTGPWSRYAHVWRHALEPVMLESNGSLFGC